MKSSQWLGKKDRIPAKECHRHSQDTTNPHSTARCSCKKTRACHFPQQKHSGNWRGKTACFTTPFPSCNHGCSTPKTPPVGKGFSFPGPKNHRHPFTKEHIACPEEEAGNTSARAQALTHIFFRHCLLLQIWISSFQNKSCFNKYCVFSSDYKNLR